ncbi:Kinesin-like protein kif22 [Allomyces javanicus]|nr:Kinesin-like protein kif22 [Allomyces javanicus]
MAGASSSSSSSSSGGKARRVRVALRVRPRKTTEQDECLALVPETASVQIPGRDGQWQEFQLDNVYGPDSTQRAIFDTNVRPMLDEALTGVNATIFAYGMTGSGKTFTIEGTSDHPGIVINTVMYLLAKRTHANDFTFSVSFFEIYCENVIDLLAAARPTSSGAMAPSGNQSASGQGSLNGSGSKSLDIRTGEHGEILVVGLQSVTVGEYADFQRAYRKAAENRSVAATNLNERSSRSHLVIQIHLKRKRGPGKAGLRAKLNLVDLAGSENNRRTGNKGQQLKESGAINTSLFTLGKVVDALNEGLPRVPYRESKMTRILQDSLGGKASALIIANVAGSKQFATETLSTLQFATKSRKIVNNPVVNHDTAPVPPPPYSAAGATSSSSDRKRQLEQWEQQQQGKPGKRAKHHHPTSGLAPPTTAASRKPATATAATAPGISLDDIKAYVDSANEKLHDKLKHEFLAELETKLPVAAPAPPRPPQTPPRHHLAPSNPMLDMTPNTSATVTRLLLDKADAHFDAGEYPDAANKYRSALAFRLAPEDRARCAARIALCTARITAPAPLAEPARTTEPAASTTEPAAPTIADASPAVVRKRRKARPPRVVVLDDDDENCMEVDAPASAPPPPPPPAPAPVPEPETAALDVTVLATGPAARRKRKLWKGASRLSAGLASTAIPSITLSDTDEPDDAKDGNYVHIPEASPPPRGPSPPPVSAKSRHSGTDQVRAVVRDAEEDGVADALLETLNSGNVEKIHALPQIGKSRAQQLVDHTTIHGRFEGIEGVLAVHGFGVKLAVKLVEGFRKARAAVGRGDAA